MIAVAAGASALSETALQVVPKSAAPGQVKLANTLGMRGGDLVLVSQQALGCMVQQVSNGFVSGSATNLTFGGTYAANVINGLSLSSFSTGNAYVSLLGNVTGNQPRVQLFGVGANATLFGYDLLGLNQTSAQALADGVVDMRVRYGVDGVDDNAPRTQQVTNWKLPSEARFAFDELTAGTSASQTRLQRILAVRVGLVLRSDQIEKSSAAPATLTLFSDLPAALQYTYTVPAGATQQRYRVVEFTVPLRNLRYSR